MHGPQKGNSRVLLSYYDTLINFCLWECHTVHLHGSVQGGVCVQSRYINECTGIIILYTVHCSGGLSVHRAVLLMDVLGVSNCLLFIGGFCVRRSYIN